MKYYEDAKYNAAFDRCVDVMSQMLQKYGSKVIDQLGKEPPADAKSDCESHASSKVA